MRAPAGTIVPKLGVEGAGGVAAGGDANGVGCAAGPSARTGPATNVDAKIAAPASARRAMNGFTQKSPCHALRRKLPETARSGVACGKQHNSTVVDFR